MENFVKTFGALKGKTDIRDYRACLTKDDITYPDEFELPMPNVKSQGSVASCVAFSISTCIEYFNLLQEKTDKTFSTGFIYGNRRGMNTGLGMSVDKAINNTVKWGDVYDSDFNYNVEVPKAIELFEASAFELAPKALPHRLSAYYKLDSINAMKAHLLQHGPIVFSIAWYSDYRVENKTYIMKHNSTQIDGYHCMVIYGWNKDGWKFQNSWGKAFGNKGRAILPYNTYLDTCYGVTDTITSEDNQEAIKELQKEINKYKLEIQDKEQELKDLQQNYDALYKRHADNEQQIEEIKSQLKELEEQYAFAVNSQGIDSVAAKSLKRKVDEQRMALELVTSDAMKTLNAIISLNEQQFELQNNLIELSKTIELQRQEIERLSNELLEIEKPFKNMPKWLAEIINAIINLFK